MKLFGKKLALLLVFALLLSTCLFTLSACDDKDDDDDDEETVEVLDSINGKTPQEAYTALISQTNSATNVEISADQKIDMNMSAQGMTIQQSMNQNIFYQINGSSHYMKMVSETTGMSPSEQLMEAWYVNGVCYSHIKGTDVSEVKAKATIDLDEFAAQYGSSASDTFPEIDAELLEDLKFTKKGNKCYAEFTVTGAQVEEMVGSMIEDSMGVDCQFGAMTYKIFFNEQGEVTGYEQNFTFSFQIEAEGTVIDTTATAKTIATVKFGTVGAINPPADASSYVDATGRL